MGGCVVERTLEEEKVYSIWVDHTGKVVSFKSVEGFEQMNFSSQEEKFAYAAVKSISGYRIQ